MFCHQIKILQTAIVQLFRYINSGRKYTVYVAIVNDLIVGLQVFETAMS